jgi:hypothetical protein
VQYAQLKHIIIAGDATADESAAVTIPASLFRQLLGAALRQAAVFDEEFYLKSNADLQAALGEGRIKDGRDHYVRTGYFEGRLPKRLLVDEKYYLEQNPDVVAAIRDGSVTTAQEHFESAGFREGRSPFRNFSLF